MAVSAALIAASALVAGNYMTNQQSSANTAAANQTSIELADTAMQRRVKDLDAAGLNPVLAVSQGGAQTPSIQVPQLGNYGQAAEAGTAAYSSANQANMLAAQVGTQVTQQGLNKAQTAKVVADTSVSTAQAANVAMDTQLKAQQVIVQQSTAAMQDSMTGLNEAQQNLVMQNIRNAVLTGKQITANTGNIQMDTALKAAQATVQQVRAKVYGNIGKVVPDPSDVGDFFNNVGSVIGHSAYDFTHSILPNPVGGYKGGLIDW